MTSSGPRVLVAIPAWNEELNIGKVLDEIRQHYPHLNVLVVDDGSQDATARVAGESGALVASHNGNRGYTQAIQTGRVYALDHGYDYLVFMDADGQHRPSDIGRILDPLIKGDADQVRGSRGLGRYEWKNEPLHLRIPRWICSTLVSLRTGRVVTDATSGFKGESRAATQYLAEVYNTSNKIHEGTTNDIEEHLLARKKGLRLMEVPVVMRARDSGDTKCYTPKHLLQFPMDLIRVFARNL